MLQNGLLMVHQISNYSKVVPVKQEIDYFVLMKYMSWMILSMYVRYNNQVIFRA